MRPVLTIVPGRVMSPPPPGEQRSRFGFVQQHTTRIRVQRLAARSRCALYDETAKSKEQMADLLQGKLASSEAEQATPMPAAAPVAAAAPAVLPKAVAGGSKSAALPMCVRACGAGGVEELSGALDDSMVCWGLLRFQVGSGTYARNKMVIIHFNGEDTPAVLRGRLNARTKEATSILGDAHASVEVKRKDEVSVEWLCERVLPFITSDDGDYSVSKLKAEYEKQIRENEKQQKRASVSARALTAKENPKCKLQAKDALRAVGKASGAFNWALLEPVMLDLHNAGYGGISEMKEWLHEDKVLFGILRFTFGQAIVKHVFVHWVGPKVSTVKRGQFNSKRGAAEAQVRASCAGLTFSKEVHELEDLNLEELIQELKRLSIVDGQGCFETAINAISVDEYMATLEKEREEQLKAQMGDLEQEVTDKPPIPEIRTGVDDVRKQAEGSCNWLIIGPGS